MFKFILQCALEFFFAAFGPLIFILTILVLWLASQF